MMSNKVRSGVACLWIATTKLANGRTFLNATGNTAEDAAEAAGDCGPDLLIQPALVAYSTDSSPESDARLSAAAASRPTPSED